MSMGLERRRRWPAVASTPVLRAGPLSRRDLIAGFTTARFTGESTARSNFRPAIFASAPRPTPCR